MSQRWASPMDWAGRRDVITRLYMDHHLPLPRVMEIMERDYEFFATPRMYKGKQTRFHQVPEGTRTRRGQADPKVSRDRFRKWKLFKYNVPGASEASQVSTRASASGKEIAIRKKSRPIIVKEDSGSPHDEETIQKTAAPIVLSKHLSPPRIFLLPETVVSLSQQFFDCQLQRHQGYLFKESMDWWWAMECALRLVEANRLQEGFEELSRCFDRFAVMLKDPEIGLLSNFYYMLIRLGPQLRGNFLDYATRMAIIKLGRGHPLTLVFDTLRRAEPQEVQDGGYLILHTHFQAAERALGGSDVKIARLSAFILQALDWQHVYSHLPADSATIEAEMWRSHERLLASGLVIEAQETLVEIAMMYVRYRRYDEAERLAAQIASWAERCGDREARTFEGRALRVHFLVAQETDDVEGCFLYGLKSLKADCWRFGRTHTRTKALLAQYQAYFKEKGRPELAAELEVEIAEEYRALSESPEVEFKREVEEVE